MSTNKYVGYTFRKLHSLLGVVPLFFFLTFHLIANATVLAGSDQFLAIVNTMVSLPGLKIIEAVVIFIPLLIHGIMGLIIVFQAKNNPKNYGYFRNWMFYIQRLSGVVMFLFIIWHLVTIKFGAETTEFFNVINGQLSSPIGLAAYVLALLGTAFHISNGLWGFGINWGILRGVTSQKYFGYIAIGLFILLSCFWFIVMFAFM